MAKGSELTWTSDQNKALKALNRGASCFITGGAGTGKSTLVHSWIKEQISASSDLADEEKSQKKLAVLASTGTAALLVGGRTFHRFFGLGIMEGGKEAVIERALKNSLLKYRLRKTHTVLIDEISMIGAQEWETAEEISRKVLERSSPWGGLRIIAVGDFAQLPPITKPWIFQSPIWHDSDLYPVVLEEVVRSEEEKWTKVLNELRWGKLSPESEEVLQSRVTPMSASRGSLGEFQGTRLFTKKFAVEAYNQDRLAELSGTAKSYLTLYVGNANRIEEIKKQAPIPEELVLKENALVMFRNNDPEQRWVNGTLGRVARLAEKEIDVILHSGKRITVEKVGFSLLDAEGEPVASATNFPINLAWACTIHKAQGATLDEVHVDLTGAWEHGQAYVALSRVRKMSDLKLESWNSRWVKVDPLVKQYYASFDNLTESS